MLLEIIFSIAAGVAGSMAMFSAMSQDALDRQAAAFAQTLLTNRNAMELFIAGNASELGTYLNGKGCSSSDCWVSFPLGGNSLAAQVGYTNPSSGTVTYLPQASGYLHSAIDTAATVRGKNVYANISRSASGAWSGFVFTTSRFLDPAKLSSNVVFDRGFSWSVASMVGSQGGVKDDVFSATKIQGVRGSWQIDTASGNLWDASKCVSTPACLLPENNDIVATFYYTP
jgi:hypothetical protein